VTAQSDIQYLLDRFEIQDVIQRYGIGQDAHRGGDDNNVLEQWDQVFTPDGTVDFTECDHVGPAAPYRQLAEQLRGENLDGTGTMRAVASWQHFEGVPTVTIDGDVAHARTPHLHTHRGHFEGTRGWNLVEAGAFHDELRRTSRGWRISHRRIEVFYTDTFVTQNDLWTEAFSTVPARP
jgi:hypothetical protein